MPADNELTAILNRRNEINDAIDSGAKIKPRFVKTSVFTDFSEFSRKQIKEYENIFQTYNSSGNGNMSLDELKTMMEKLKAPQTHLGLKSMIKEVDEDNDGHISFREFLLIFRKAAAGELDMESGLGKIARSAEVNVDEIGVEGAKSFFEAKIAEANKGGKFEREIKDEQEERKKAEAEKKSRLEMFRERAALFGGGS